MNAINDLSLERLGIKSLNGDQSRAMNEIEQSIAAGDDHLLDGPAGSGKTTLMQVLAMKWSGRAGFVLTAPTHKAVEVLRRKLKQIDVDVGISTIHSLLSLRPKIVDQRQVFERVPLAKPPDARVVVIDEASMLGSDLMAHIRKILRYVVVIYVGDIAQLPPVGEIESDAFRLKLRSHLATIERQSGDNPILDAADIIRRSQGQPADWSWCRKAMKKPLGVYVPGAKLDDWMRKAFTSDEFNEDPDSFRYLAYTNARVTAINNRIRRWRYGETTTPFVAGERALVREPVIQDDAILLHTNEEATVVEIERATASVLNGEWRVPSWRITLRNDEGLEVFVDTVREPAAYTAALDKLVKDKDWKAYHVLKQSFARIQSIYALTIHTSQGSTFKNCFIDVPELKWWSRNNLLESQKGTYVGVTRASHALILAGV